MDAPAARRANLALYLRQMQARNPSLLLVGEAPSYRGARITGVPFAGRTMLLDGIPGVPLFGREKGYTLPEEDQGRTLNREATATILWNVIAALDPLPLLWNSYPFHPHLPGNPFSNRKPRMGELAIGKRFLQDMLAMFEIRQIVAIGNTAYDALCSLEIACEKVRHPSQGGKRDFVAGLERILGNTKR
ncbi:MAG: uracil-DNA glycosylase [bacterium]|nr:uracil-DNA glycosylase [bacterium]